jgi:RNA 2',3'-cyclic 3'-phosphodiesterase
VPEARLSEVIAIGAAVAAECDPGSVRVSLETLEYWKEPGVLCATTAESPSALLSGAVPLADKLKSRLSAAGFTPDLKPFRPHVTMARKVMHPCHLRALIPVIWSFTEFALIESRTESQGPEYHVRESFQWPG